MTIRNCLQIIDSRAELADTVEALSPVRLSR